MKGKKQIKHTFKKKKNNFDYGYLNFKFPK